MTSTRHLLALLGFVIGCGPASAQVKEPPRPEKLEIQIRYRIRAERDDRVRQFRELEKFLASLGFDDARKDDPNRDLDILDPNAERFVGTIPSKNVFELLKDGRVQNILFAPAGYMYPDAGDKFVPIRVVLHNELLPSYQQAFHAQALAQLEQLGFKEALGYDTRNDPSGGDRKMRFLQIKGAIPYKNLNRLVKDLRTEPAGWFLPETPPDRLPRPFADRNPIRWVEVMAASDLPPAFAPEPILPARARITPDLRAVLVNPALKETPLSVEVLFSAPMEGRLGDLRSRLVGGYPVGVKRTADGTVVKAADGTPELTEGASVQGVIGNVVTIRFDRPEDVDRFMLEAGVLSVRLPRRAVETVGPAGPDLKPVGSGDLLKTSGVETLQKTGYAGAGVKVIVLGSDFTGAEKQIGSTLPRRTQILDLTTELNPEILPAPGDEGKAAANLAVARAVALAAPDAELVLVRIDTGSFFQLERVLRAARGDILASIALSSRLAELSNRSADLTRKKDLAVVEYRQAFEDQSDDEPTRLRRQRAKAALDAILAMQKELSLKFERYNKLEKIIPPTLAGARVVVNTLVWESGYPIDGLSDFSRTLDRLSAPQPPKTIRPATGSSALPRPHLVWVQAASQSGASVWGGTYLDVDNNGTMEFAPPEAPLPEDSWNAEMNFLGSRSANGEVSPELAAGAKLRFVMQWRETINPLQPGLDVPNYPLVLRVFRQIDPAGEKRPSDEMAEDGRSAGGPYPIVRTSTYVVYEQILEFTVPQNGRYAFLVSTAYRVEPLLPSLRNNASISPRLFVETLSAKPGEPVAVFRSYRSTRVGVGIPGDSQGAVTIGTAKEGAVSDGGTGVQLLLKPDYTGPEAIDLPGVAATQGIGIASGFAAGIAADLVQADAAGPNVFRWATVPPGKPIMLPDAWLRYLRPIPRPVSRKPD